MPPAILTTLTLISGISWSIVYIDIIHRSFKDRTYGMPLFALALNIAWEFVFAFVTGFRVSVQKIVNVVWFVLDAIIVFAYFKHGRRDFPKSFEKYFVPWSLAAFAVGAAVIYAFAIEFGEDAGARYSAFGQNLLMSVLFILMIIRRNNVDGQSMTIAVFKWIGTLAPTIEHYYKTGSLVILVFGAGCFVYDLIYIWMLRNKFVELGLNPWNRKPIPVPSARGKYKGKGLMKTLQEEKQREKKR
jgi:hypothetical protein